MEGKLEVSQADALHEPRLEDRRLLARRFNDRLGDFRLQVFFVRRPEVFVVDHLLLRDLGMIVQNIRPDWNRGRVVNL